MNNETLRVPNSELDWQRVFRDRKHPPFLKGTKTTLKYYSRPSLIDWNELVWREKVEITYRNWWTDCYAIVRGGFTRSPLPVGAPLGIKLNHQKRPSSCRNLFTFIELFSRILPAKIRTEAFEPAYNDEKSSYLQDRRHYKSASARKWLAFCFCLHVALMAIQCFWGMCSDKVKRLLFESLPALFRNHLGN